MGEIKSSERIAASVGWNLRHAEEKSEIRMSKSETNSKKTKTENDQNA